MIGMSNAFCPVPVLAEPSCLKAFDGKRERAQTNSPQPCGDRKLAIRSEVGLSRRDNSIFSTNGTCFVKSLHEMFNSITLAVQEDIGAIQYASQAEH